MLYVQKQSSADAHAHMLRSDPHVFQLGQRFTEGNRATAGDFVSIHRRVHLVVIDELRRNRQVGLPMLDPVFGITPVALGSVRDFSQDACFLRLGSANLNIHSAWKSSPFDSNRESVE